MATTNVQKVSVIDPDGLLDERAVAKRLNCTVKALQKWRVTGSGPVYSKIGYLVRYSPQSIQDYILSRRRTSTSQGDSAA